MDFVYVNICAYLVHKQIAYMYIHIFRYKLRVICIYTFYIPMRLVLSS